MTQMLERTDRSTYAPPALEPLGSLQGLTKGAGPNGEPMVMSTGMPIPPFSDDAQDASVAFA
jgi:hypothetical protein